MGKHIESTKCFSIDVFKQQKSDKAAEIQSIKTYKIKFKKYVWNIKIENEVNLILNVNKIITLKCYFQKVSFFFMKIN